MESKCFTHLGHNLPDAIFNGRDRYCIDLVCIAGDPSYSFDGTGAASIDESSDILKNSEFDAGNYTSSAENQSGKHPKTQQTLIITAIIISGMIVVFIAGHKIRKRSEKRKTMNDIPVSKILT